ncbi:MAG TPA: hypothetical protein VNM24_04325 [Burkholderiales bacterium]|jgi:hypothetical protein|nr:hypothetical protein [Burkholderiales bacterium]
MKRGFVSVMAIAVAGVVLSTESLAGRVTMPKEGSYEFDFCPIGRGKVFSAGDKLFVMNYDLEAVLRSTPAGKAFDRMGARCFGIYSNISGRQQEAGICELTDLDGDKWWMDYRGNPDGKGGTYTSVHGTGKYESMILRGEYRIDNDWGSISKEVSFQGCNPNKGAYKLK